MEVAVGVLTGGESIQCAFGSLNEPGAQQSMNDKSGIPEPESFVSIWTGVNIVR